MFPNDYGEIKEKIGGVMNRRTYELLAQWIANETKVHVEFSDKGPLADVKNKRIYMPYNVKDGNVFSILAWLLHEAAHIKYTDIPQELSTSPEAHEILNVIEDIRIDRKNFNLLPNIKDFYRRMIEDHVLKQNIQPFPLYRRALVNTILTCEGFKIINDPASYPLTKAINPEIEEAVRAVEYDDWPKLRKLVQEILKKLNLKESKKQQQQQEDEGEGDGEKSKEKIKGGGKGKAMSAPSDKSLEEILHPSSLWGKGHLEGASSSVLGKAAFQDNTKRAFKELLNIKESRLISDGNKLNTDNLTDFFTGNIEELFHEEDIVKKKKSKIVFLLDASGSMQSELLDRKRRKETVIKCINAMTEILDEVIETEGFNISYEVHAFTENLHILNQDNWEKGYTSLSGGTCIVDPFSKIQKRMLKEQEIDGKRIIVVITDGDVDKSEIDDVRKEILRHNEDVRCMFVGVGAEVAGAFSKNIVGDNNIIMEELSDQVILDVIMAML